MLSWHVHLKRLTKEPVWWCELHFQNGGPTFQSCFPSGWGQHIWTSLMHCRRWNRWNGWMNGLTDWLGISSESPWAVYANSNWVRKSRQRTREVAATADCRSGQMSSKPSFSLRCLLVHSAGHRVRPGKCFTQLARHLLCKTSPPPPNKKGGEIWQRLMGGIAASLPTLHSATPA